MYCFMYVFHKLLSYFLNLIALNSEIHHNEIRLASNFHIRFCNTKLRALSIHIIDVKLWTILIPAMSSVCSIHVFKKKYRQYLIHCN